MVSDRNKLKDLLESYLYRCHITTIPTFPLDTGRKFNVYKTFRRRPGRLLSVSCTFILHPVSRGFIHELVSGTAIFGTCYYYTYNVAVIYLLYTIIILIYYILTYILIYLLYTNYTYYITILLTMYYELKSSSG